MKTKTYLFILSMLCVCLCAPLTVNGQVKIGGSDTPAQGAVLDLNADAAGSYSGGLLLPNVFIEDVEYIPASFTDADKMEGFDSTTGVDTNADLSGVVVYNTNDGLVDGAGVYVWNGNTWQIVSGGTPVIGAFAGEKDVVISFEGGTLDDLGGADALNTQSGDYKFVLVHDADGAAELDETDAVAGKFAVKITENETENNRTAIVRIISPSRAYQDYYLNQAGKPIAVPTTRGSGSSLIGQNCYDVAVINNRDGCGLLVTRRDKRPDFSVPQKYNFTAGSNISNVRVTTEEFGNAAGKIFEGATVEQIGSTNQWTIHVKMKENLFEDAATLTAPIALKGRIIVVYNENGRDVYADTKVMIQDCLCCGARTNATGGWLAFMCHNLGADTSLDPFVPAPGLHGGKYRWGQKNESISMEHDQLSSGLPIAWDDIPRNADRTTWLAEDSPCPEGWRLPGWSGLTFLANHNRVEFVGRAYDGSYESGIKIGDALFLPAAGERRNSSPTIHGRGTWVHYELGENNNYNSTKRRSPWFWTERGVTVTTDNHGSQNYAIAVRCVMSL